MHSLKISNYTSKNYKIKGNLKEVFRHDLCLQKQTFKVVVVLTQMMLENGHPLFQVRYTTRSYPGFNR